MSAYEPAYAQEALEALLAAGSAQRSQARALVRQICRTPGRLGDYRTMDKAGQVWEVVLVDGAILTYRPDHAVRELRIATIEWVD